LLLQMMRMHRAVTYPCLKQSARYKQVRLVIGSSAGRTNCMRHPWCDRGVGGDRNSLRRIISELT
jgi:hypothetical protein